MRLAVAAAAAAAAAATEDCRETADTRVLLIAVATMWGQGEPLIERLDGERTGPALQATESATPGCI